ncbi:DUF416 family protein [Bradyrhizobium sp. HKCCYLRH3061]|uniref:DUF416 family protein n=1 Tax=unclassified Bradyrhizobium TaxID=2631580 RepID=UPI003EB9AAA6
MMKLIPNEAATKLLSFSAGKKLAFLILLYERMMPELRSFCLTENRDFSIFHTAREEYWRSLLDGSRPMSWAQLRQDILDAIPDTEDFGSLEVSFTLNAALVAANIADFMVDARDVHIVEAMQYPLESLHAYVSDQMGLVAYDKAINNIVGGHPLVQKEAQTEEGDVAFLSTIEDPPWSESMYSLVRARAEGQHGLLS